GAPWLAARAATAAEDVAAQHHSGRDVAVMLAIEHAPELRVGGRLDAVLAQSERRHRDWGHAADRAAAPAAVASAVQLTRSRIAARRLHDLTEPDSDMRTRPAVPHVELEPGARLAVTGPSGSGKTTLLMAMAENPSQAAFFAEDAHLFATTVRDNLLVARGDAADQELRNTLRRG